MGGCGSGGGCGVGNAYNPGQYVGIRINQHEDGRSVLCDTMGFRALAYHLGPIVPESWGDYRQYAGSRSAL